MRRLTLVIATATLVLGALAAPAGASPSDQDNDTVPNRRDLCPTAAGTRSDGCPRAQWKLNDLNGPPPADYSFPYGSLGWTPVAGDWGFFDSVGGFDRSTGKWHLRDDVCPCTTFTNFTFDVDVPGPHLPIAGDWNGDGLGDVGLYTPSNGTFHLRTSLTSGGADITFAFGGPQPGRFVRPVAGDWDGDGKDSIGLFRADTNRWRLRNTNDAGPPSTLFRFGRDGSTERPVAGDWNGDSTSTPGVFDAGTFFLRNANSTGSADLTRAFGPSNAMPVAGDWNVDGFDSIGIQRR
jgi:hypothetical protein